MILHLIEKLKETETYFDSAHLFSFLFLFFTFAIIHPTLETIRKDWSLFTDVMHFTLASLFLVRPTERLIAMVTPRPQPSSLGRNVLFAL